MISKILIPLLALSLTIISPAGFRIVTSNQTSIIIEYTPQFVDTSIRKIDNQEFRNIGLAFGYVDESLESGIPEIPERRLVIGVPTEFGNSIRGVNFLPIKF